VFADHSNIPLKIGKWKVSFYELAAFGVILLDFCMRFALIYQGWPRSNSDEGTLGLMALHIAYHGAFPLFFYGQGYMGPLEAYVGAALFLLLGTTVLALRTGVLLLFTFFLVLMYRLARQLYNKTLALITLILLSLGTPEILLRETLAQAGHPETPLFCAAIILFSVQLALSIHSRSEDAALQRRGKRLLLYSLWGLLMGVAFWNDFLIWPFVLLAAFSLWLFCRSELRQLEYVGILLGFLTGIVPAIIYNLTAPINQSSFSVFGFLIAYHHAPISSSLLDKLAGSLLVSLPIATGANPLCPLQSGQAWPLSQLSSYGLRCTLVHGGWGLALIVLWVVAFVPAIRELLRSRHHLFKAADSFADERNDERKEAIFRFARVMILAGAGLSFVVFALSAQSVTDPWANNRYLVALAVAVPAMLWPLWSTTKAAGRLASAKLAVQRALIGGALLVFTASLILGTIATFAQIPTEQRFNRQQDALVGDLLQLHITHMYTDYWTCDLTAFLSRERITCDVLDEQLQQGVNRYTPYIAMVEHDPNAAYVFPIGSPQSAAFAQKNAQDRLHYRLIAADTYDIFLPASPS